MPLLVKSNTITRDGISYELIWKSGELDGSIRFSNPESEILSSLQAASLDLAISLTKQSHDHEMFKFVEEWKRYAANGG